MLPLKAGVCIMALGAMLDQNTAPVRIVPCGLNYYKVYYIRISLLMDKG